MVKNPTIRKNFKGEKFVPFFGSRNVNFVCSNWYPSIFVIEGLTFNCVEQYMMYKKAELFQDNEIANKIIKETDPKTIKSLGRKVKNFDTVIWGQHGYNFVKEAVYAKFTQNKELYDWILKANCEYFVECSPYDEIWGIKLSIGDERVKNPEYWLGSNKLGKAITEVRQMIIENKV